MGFGFDPVDHYHMRYYLNYVHRWFKYFGICTEGAIFKCYLVLSLQIRSVTFHFEGDVEIYTFLSVFVAARNSISGIFS